MIKVWENSVDNTYPVYVTRSEEDAYKGTLCVEFEGKVVFSKEVTISYAAQFGPDAGDISFWADECIKFIDAITEEDKARWRKEASES